MQVHDMRVEYEKRNKALAEEFARKCTSLPTVPELEGQQGPDKARWLISVSDRIAERLLSCDHLAHDELPAVGICWSTLREDIKRRLLLSRMTSAGGSRPSFIGGGKESSASEWLSEFDGRLNRSQIHRGIFRVRCT